MDFLYIPDFAAKPKKPWYKGRFLWLSVILIFIFFGAKYSGLGSATITVVNRIAGNSNSQQPTDPKIVKIIDDPEYQMPVNDKNRLDVLIMGIRGKNDVANGGMLTDTIMLLSIDTQTGKAALTSIPRDLTVRVTDTKTEKINTAYIYNGLAGTKKLYSRITGVNIDNVIVFDFDAFKYIVDTLGGITITLDKPFDESQQWSGDEGYAFKLPAGINDLNGDQALYYARSRYSTSDFDRSRRQMQIIMAIKAKADALNIKGDPLKAMQLIAGIRQHIETDLGIFDLGTIKDLISEGNNLDKIKRYQLTTENVLYETTVNGIYELLPRDGTLSHIKGFFQTVLTESPTLPTPIPAGASPRVPVLSTTPTP